MNDFQFPIPIGEILKWLADAPPQRTRRRLYMPHDAFKTHAVATGATGSGKTSIFETLIYALAQDEDRRRSIVVVDPLGPMAARLMRFFANPDYVSDETRDRLIYFEPAHEHHVATMQPLLHDSLAHRDYRITRASDLILRGFSSQSTDEMPRLRRWIYRTLVALSVMGYPLSVSRYLLNPKLPEHPLLIARLPEVERAEWEWLIREGRQEAIRQLESTMNRLSLFSDYSILNRMFGSTEHRFHMGQFMEEGKIVVINLSPGAERLPQHPATTIGALLLNDVFNYALTHFQKTGEPLDVYLFVDEFWMYLGPDIFHFLPILRNMGVHLIFAHQSFGQLVKGDLDLTPLYAQLRSRFMFANEFEDANILAEELTSLTWDPDKILRQYHTFRQRMIGHETAILESWGRSHTSGKTSTGQTSTGSGTSIPKDGRDKGSRSDSTGASRAAGESQSDGDTHNWHQQLVPVHEDFYELAREDRESREEHVDLWQKRVRKLTTGQTVAKIVNDPEPHLVQVDYLPQDDDPRIDDLVAKLLEENYARAPFITAAEADREGDAIRRELLSGPKVIVTDADQPPRPTDGNAEELLP